MRLFYIDYKKLAVMLLPTFLRQPALTALIRALMQPLVTLHDLFRLKRDEHLFDLGHNGQVCYLKHALNSLDNLDYNNGFLIDDINAIGDFIMVYDESLWTSQGTPWLVSDQPNGTLVYDENAINVQTGQFIVFVPQQYSFTGNIPDDKRITATVQKYKLAGKTATYRIKP